MPAARQPRGKAQMRFKWLFPTGRGLWGAERHFQALLPSAGSSQCTPLPLACAEPLQRIVGSFRLLTNKANNKYKECNCLQRDCLNSHSRILLLPPVPGAAGLAPWEPGERTVRVGAPVPSSQRSAGSSRRTSHPLSQELQKISNSRWPCGGEPGGDGPCVPPASRAGLQGAQRLNYVPGVSTSTQPPGHLRATA